MKLAQRRRTASFPPAWRLAFPLRDGPIAVAPHARAVPFRAALTALATGIHPLADPAISDVLERRAEEIRSAFDSIEPVLRALARHQFDDGFTATALDQLHAGLHLSVPSELLAVSWAAPLDMRRLYAHCVLVTFCRLIERQFDRDHARFFEGDSAEDLVQRWGFHAIDITPCADGRLSGVLDYILRVPPAVVAFRKSYAGAMFDVEESLRHWESVEVRRLRERQPCAGASTRYLKIGVYHFSSVAPRHEGCAAHGSDEVGAAAALLERLQKFEQAVQSTHGAAAQVATLLVGVDTDTDAIRLHVPDAAGQMAVARTVDSAKLYTLTQSLSRDVGKAAIRSAVAACAGVAEDDPATEGMRWFCGYLLKNNLAQVDAVLRGHGGRYADGGHTERLIVIGDAVDDVQLRNLAFQAQMDTIEEGAADLDIGVRILKSLHEPRRLPVPVLVHARFDTRIPGARERAERRAHRLCGAIAARFTSLVDRGDLVVQAVVRAGDTGTLFSVEPGAPVRPSADAAGSHT